MSGKVRRDKIMNDTIIESWGSTYGRKYVTIFLLVSFTNIRICYNVEVIEKDKYSLLRCH